MNVHPKIKGQSTDFVTFYSINLVVNWFTNSYNNTGDFLIKINACINRPTPVCNS